MTVRQLIKKLKVFGRERFVVVGRKDIVGTALNDDGDVELILAGIEESQLAPKKPDKKPKFVSHYFGMKIEMHEI